jgi:hypothetical protein
MAFSRCIRPAKGRGATDYQVSQPREQRLARDRSVSSAVNDDARSLGRGSLRFVFAYSNGQSAGQWVQSRADKGFERDGVESQDDRLSKAAFDCRGVCRRARSDKATDWQTGKVLDTDRPRYFAGTVGSGNSNGNRALFARNRTGGLEIRRSCPHKALLRLFGGTGLPGAAEAARHRCSLVIRQA